MKRRALIIFSMVLVMLMSSCTVTKRRYMGGFYIDRAERVKKDEPPPRIKDTGLVPAPAPEPAVHVPKEKDEDASRCAPVTASAPALIKTAIQARPTRVQILHKKFPKPPPLLQIKHWASRDNLGAAIAFMLVICMLVPPLLNFLIDEWWLSPLNVAVWLAVELLIICSGYPVWSIIGLLLLWHFIYTIIFLAIYNP